MTQEVIDKLLVRMKSVIFTTDPCMPLFYANQDLQGDFEKQSIFKLVSKTEKSAKLHPRLPKNTQKRPSKHQTTIFAKTWFSQYFPCENLVLRAPAVNNFTRKSMQKVNWKHPPKNIEFNVSRLKKLPK